MLNFVLAAILILLKNLGRLRCTIASKRMTSEKTAVSQLRRRGLRGQLRQVTSWRTEFRLCPLTLFPGTRYRGPTAEDYVLLR